MLERLSSPCHAGVPDQELAMEIPKPQCLRGRVLGSLPRRRRRARGRGRPRGAARLWMSNRVPGAVASCGELTSAWVVRPRPVVRSDDALHARRAKLVPNAWYGAGPSHAFSCCTGEGGGRPPLPPHQGERLPAAGAAHCRLPEHGDDADQSVPGANKDSSFMSGIVSRRLSDGLAAHGRGILRLCRPFADHRRRS
jgi:hypothetical protein